MELRKQRPPQRYPCSRVCALARHRSVVSSLAGMLLCFCMCGPCVVCALSATDGTFGYVYCQLTTAQTTSLISPCPTSQAPACPTSTRLTPTPTSSYKGRFWWVHRRQLRLLRVPSDAESSYIARVKVSPPHTCGVGWGSSP